MVSTAAGSSCGSGEGRARRTWLMSETGEPLTRSCCVQLFMKLSEATVPLTVPLYLLQMASEEAAAAPRRARRARFLSMVVEKGQSVL